MDKSYLVGFLSTTPVQLSTDTVKPTVRSSFEWKNWDKWATPFWKLRSLTLNTGGVIRRWVSMKSPSICWVTQFRSSSFPLRRKSLRIPLPYPGPPPPSPIILVLKFNAVKTNQILKKSALYWGHNTTTTPHSYQFIDNNLPVGIHYYRLKQIDTNGAFEYSHIATAHVGVPNSYQLSQNFPNPFNPETMIKYQLPQDGQVLLKIYNLLGQVISTLVNEEQSAGYYTVKWDGKDEHGRRIASGVYVYLLIVNFFASNRKLLVIH